MGRLFWKFFLCIWLAQLAAVVGTGALFWMERQPGAANLRLDGRPPPDFPERPPPEFAQARPPRPPHGQPPSGPLPLLPVIAGLFASLLCAGGLAWYFAKPIRHLRNAFEAAAGGNLAVRVTPSMGGRRDELADLGHDFDRMTAQLQAVIDGQKRLLHDVSHEMRSPLARLQAAIGLARQQPGRTEDSLQRIAREGERIDQLVGELLTLSRLEAGVTGELENVELGELLANIAEDARFEGASRGITIDFVAGATAEVRANAELLHRALENVVRNALRYSPAGGVVQIAGRRTGDQVFRITISDQGPGVAAGDLDAIFTPFFRSEGQGAAGGYGLGLAIARRAIVAVDGQISARNGSAGGLVVDIALPL